jgi:tetratricopeptide (TPR) repeat protein
MNTPSTPDAQALLQAAIEANQRGDAERALGLLRQSVAARHLNPIAHYLLGTEYAQAQRYGDAVLHLTSAVEQAPELFTARLQLGLLWLTLANPATAVAQLQPLAGLPDTDALHHFGRGLVHLAGDDLPAARDALARGLAIGSDNAPLLGDMRLLVERIDAMAASAPQQQPAAAPGFAPDPAALASMQRDIALSAYAAREPKDR